MLIRETERKLRVIDLPWGSWTWGTILLGIFGGLAVLILVSAWQDPSEFIGTSREALYQRGLSIVMFSLLFAFACYVTKLSVSMLLTPSIIVTLDRQHKTVFIRRRGIFSGRSERYPFSQINGFCKETVEDDFRSFYLGLTLANGDVVRLGSNVGSDPTPEVRRLNTFLKKN